ncbi:MAG: AAA family ATPase [Candidatus Roseilinea sp.]|uniref:AAA family ATPase n=1 Tax=Candidatus Roseilinea sp. TaxID=2838777 RepID=UPI00404B5359
MIPLKLELKNFMAYRDAEPLDLTGLHVVCLTGENGAGKSTLLDALTWALWGKARGKTDDSLISQGQTEMRVALTFSEGDNVYQVVRTRKLGRPGAKGKVPASTGTLDLLVQTQAGWRTLSEPRQSDTQKKIIDILNLTYDTFLNSAYLKQGKADEFTLKTPAERKALLAEILSLDVWQDYENAVKTQQQELERNQSVFEFGLQKANEEIARLPQYERDLELANRTLATATAALQEAEQAQAEITRLQEEARSLNTQQARAKAQLQTIESELAGLEAERANHQQRLSDYQSAIDQRAEIEQGYAEYQAARQRDAEWTQKLSSLVELQQRQKRAETEIAEARRELQFRRDAAAQRVHDLEQLADSDKLRTQLAEAHQQWRDLIASQNRREETTRRLAETRERQAGVKAENDELYRRMKELKARIDALSKVGAICPTCGRELAETDRARLLAEWRAEGERMGDRYRANERTLQELAAARKADEDAIADLGQTLLGLPGIQREVAALEERLKRAEEATSQLPEARAALDTAEAELRAETYAPAARVALAQVEAELEQLGYDAAAHKQLREEILPRLEAFVQRKSQLDKAEIGLQSEQRALESISLRQEKLAQQRAAQEAEIAKLNEAIHACDAGLKRAPEVEQAAQLARRELFVAQRKLAEAAQRVEACKAMCSERDRLRHELDELARRQSLLDELRAAFSKNGVPAMIIENILPELEDSANELLSRMTGGRMNVRFETQRQTQKGDVSETLELRISDELGERLYEMFSGGESFRINFAVRIALSKLLAHRAGARLQTLIIDEGFGTQDAKGREALIDAIRSIESDFERIFVITHIDELKDAFPARIEVVKGAHGSIARLV